MPLLPIDIALKIFIYSVFSKKYEILALIDLLNFNL